MTRTLRITGMALLIAATCATARAEAPKLGDGKGQVTLTWDEFVKITGYDPAKKGSQVLTIPWTQVEELTGLKVAGAMKNATVDLKWNEFRALLEWSIKRKDETPPPADYIVSANRYTGVLADDGATFQLVAQINVLRQKGWKRIPILPTTVALMGAKLPDGVFLNAAGKTYELLTDKSGPIDVTIDFAVAVNKSAGINQVGFQRVLGGSSVLDLAIGRKEVDVKVTGSQSLVSKTADQKTQVIAAVPSGTAVAISWERALPKVAAAPTKLYAEVAALVAVADGLLLCQEVVNYNILHTAVRELGLQVPAGASVLTVTGSNVQDWRVDKDGKLQVILKAEVIGTYSLRITFEQPTAAAETPVIHPTGVQRQRGYLGVVAVANVEIAAGAVSAATAIDVRQLPADLVAMTHQPILLAFRYLGDQPKVPLTIKKHAEVGVLVTIVDSGVYTAMQLADGRRITKAIYSVRNNRNQFLRLKMPKDSEIWSVSVAGNTVSPAKDESGSVLVPLVRSARSSRELAAFPAEIVYVETPKGDVPDRGQVHVDLPVCNVPVVHVMYNYYAPAKGKYTIGWGASGFSGPLPVVEAFTSLATGAGRQVVQVQAAKQARQMQKAFDARVDAQARAAGATPLRVRLPINGKLFRLEKILVLPNDRLYFDLHYSGWKASK